MGYVSFREGTLCFNDVFFFGDLIFAIPEHAEWEEWRLYQMIVIKQGPGYRIRR